MIMTMTILLTMNDGVYIKKRVAVMILMILMLISMTPTLAMTVILVNDLGSKEKDAAVWFGEAAVDINDHIDGNTHDNGADDG